MGVVFSVVLLVAVVLTLVDIITRADWQIKHLPKLVWVILVVFVPLIGVILWFLVGREYGSPPENLSFGDPRRWNRNAAPAHAAPAALPPASSSQKSTEEQIEELNREIEYWEQLQRRQAEKNAIEPKQIEPAIEPKQIAPKRADPTDAE